ncbi:hypothetical protein BZA05DRAFT_357600 [Tricharina praecox]|uniref:uncharacterized protein n=1 Tax=Tricharina praecox TaxID=43433 RepID=UPI00221F57C2|nr:uncharacterized protein BZA05DRAFT_357600 [Tricharina praecox]KAI5846156.1 hypothetical protein BZA05DRAFT_357600 [Tricharina praecox]
MSSLDISPEIGRAYQKLVSGSAPNKPSPTYAQWAVFSVSVPLQNAFVQSSAKASTLKVHAAGDGELEELIEEFNDGKVQFAFVKVKDPNSGLPKFVLICWCGDGVPERVKGYFTGHLNAVTKVLHGYHVQVTARSDSDLSPEAIIQKVADASGSKYSSSSSSNAPPPTAPKPPVATKPVFQPTRVLGGMLPVGSRAPARRDEKVDADGWGADAPQVTRSQLEKVQSAYKPTKVDINELRSQPTSTTSGYSKSSDEQGEVVKGGYQPIGKIDIAALKKGYKEERPEPVKGSYTPIDVSSIRKAAPARPEPEPTPAASVSQRAGAFSQSERLTSLPKPKVAKKFGPGAPSYGTKPLTPGGFGASPAAPAPVAGINKSGITKSPAQIWAEKKARERGLSGASTPPTLSPATTGQQHITPSYTGASASSQHHEEEVTSSSTGINALRNRFSGAAPMGAPTPSSPQRPASFSPTTTGDRGAPPPPPVDTSSRPSFGVPMPGLPSRSTEEEEDEEVPAVQHSNIPPPPRQPRSPTPPTPEIEMPHSPVRIAMPVARRDDDALITKPEEPSTAIPVASLSSIVPRESELTDEAPARPSGGATGGQRAVVLYDYAADEENEINLIEGQVVTDIDMVDDDWWRGTNALGQEGLFPSNYVELMPAGAAEAAVERAPSPPPSPPAPAVTEGKTALAIYDYEATEDNELSFPDGATIEDVQFPDDDWWHGHYKGKEGLFPANYVELQN